MAPSLFDSVGVERLLEQFAHFAFPAFRRQASELLEASDLVAWRVRRGKLCEVLAAIDLNGKRRRVGTAKTIFFHEVP